MTDTLNANDLELLDRIVAEAIEPVSPPAGARALVLDAIRRTPQLDTAVPGEHESLTVRAAEGTWKTIAPGARTKRLSKDETRGTVTFLLEMEPHAIVAGHDHTGAEESFVVRGSCNIGALGLSQGDFHRVEPHAHHGDLVASDEGCVLLITMHAQAA
jgi:anti-sigma factor ChrR (cupin superfamily)